MDYFKNNSNTMDCEKYKKYLRRMISDSSYKDKLEEEDKLAIVFLFNLEFYPIYNQEKAFVKTMLILNYYVDLVQDKNDLFQRQVLDFSRVPKQVKKYLFAEFKKYNKNVDKALKTNSLYKEDNNQQEINNIEFPADFSLDKKYKVVEVTENEQNQPTDFYREIGE